MVLMPESSLIIFVSPKTITIFQKDGSSQNVELVGLAFKDFKVVDAEKLKEGLIKVLSNIERNKREGVLVLSSDLFKHGIFKKDSFVDAGEEIESFYSGSGFADDDLFEKTIKTNLGIETFATSEAMCREISKVLAENDISCKYVVALMALGEFEDSNMTTPLAKQLFNSDDLLKESDFLTEKGEERKEASTEVKTTKVSEVEDKPEEQKVEKEVEKVEEPSVEEVVEQVANSGAGNKLIFGLAAALILIVVAGLAVYFDKVNIPLGFLRKEEAVEEIPVASELPEVKEVAKGELKAMVLNGSGVAGQAGRVKTSLEELGLVNVEVGNADSQESVDTVVEFSSAVSQADGQEVLEALKADFANVVSKEVSEFPDFDVQITTGEEK